LQASLQYLGSPDGTVEVPPVVVAPAVLVGAGVPSVPPVPAGVVPPELAIDTAPLLLVVIPPAPFRFRASGPRAGWRGHVASCRPTDSRENCA
jgi:hypothetical protein